MVVLPLCLAIDSTWGSLGEGVQLRWRRINLGQGDNISAGLRVGMCWICWKAVEAVEFVDADDTSDLGVPLFYTQSQELANKNGRPFLR